MSRNLIFIYEKILKKINECDVKIQKLIQKTFHWFYCENKNLFTNQFCQTIVIKFENVWIDYEIIFDESNIFRHCDSLIRKSIIENQFEFAHFTIKKFLSQFDNINNNEFAAYVINVDVIKNEFAKICFIYIIMRNFERYENANENNFSFKQKKRFFFYYVD